MKIRILILFLFNSLFCFSQQAILIDTSIYNNSTFKPLKDCQKFINYRPEDSLCAELIRSYQFDENGSLKKILYCEEGLVPDTTLTILNYDKDNKQINRINYDKVHGDTLIDGSKVLSFYNKKGLLMKKVGLDIVIAKQTYDTLFVQEFGYNSKGQKVTESLRNIENWLMSTGLQKFKYDKRGRLKEIEKIATAGTNSATKRPEDNYTVYYTYFGDSAYKETQIFNLINKEHNTFLEQTYFNDHKGNLVKTVQTYIQHVEILFVNGKYVPNPESNTAYIDKTTTVYKYDKLGRIEQCFYSYTSDNKNSGWKTQGDYVILFKYKDNGLYKLPTDEYVDDE